MRRRGRWKSVLERIHVYGGLFSVGFLITFGFSAFVHQHHPGFIKPGSHTVYWEDSFHVPSIADNLEFKHAVRDSLGLFGHTPWWEDYRDSMGVHHFMITRPGKQYWVTVPGSGSIFRIREIRTGVLDVMNQLHPLAAGMQGHGNGPFFIRAWRFISLPMAILLFCVILVTIHLWYRRWPGKPGNWIIISIALVFPAVLLIFIWLVG